MALTRKRQEKLRGMIDDWRARRPRAGSTLRVPPRELAVLLGHLVFGSQVVPGGRTYMQGMLSQFQGLEIDWSHGVVRFSRSRGEWGLVEVSDGFWRDLEWWSDHFERRNCTLLAEVPHGSAAITGTDASDWGTGQLVWIDGGREEVALMFSRSETSRSINWRELLGIVRIFEHFGHRLAGRVVLVETDNMAAKGAASKMSSSSEDMQELIRRLLEAAVRHGIVLRFTHTPGVKLIRPDQTSRGDPVEEPRSRLSSELFSLLSSRFGPFSEMMGAEREFERASGSAPRIWMHPTYSTVASALRMLGERMGRGDAASGVVVVPDDSSAAWWKLTRHFRVVGRIERGSGGLEVPHCGRWRPTSFRRDTLILAFPRAAGSMVLPVWRPLKAPRLDGLVLNLEGSARALPLMQGSLVYSRGLTPGEHGVLYLVWRSFSPAREGGAIYLEEGSDMRCVQTAQLTRSFVRSGRSRSKVWDTEGGKLVYSLNLRRDAGDDGAFAPGVGSTPWLPSAELLWSVDHLVTEVSDVSRATSASPSMAPLLAKVVARRRFTFDFRQAEREIAGFEGRQRRTSATQASLSAPSGDPQDRVTETLAEPEVPATPPPAEERRSGRLQGHRLGDVMLSPGRIERRIRAERRRDEASSLAEALEAVSISEDEPPTQAARAEQELLDARASAQEAADARTYPARATAPATDPTEARLPQVSREGRQLNRYHGTLCEGCHLTIEWGSWMVSGGRAMCHDSHECVALAERELTESVAAKQSAAAERAKGPAASEKREAQLAHRFSDERCRNLRECIEGRCKATGTRTWCTAGCGRGVHVTSCLQMSSARATLGAFKCGDCRAEEMMPYSCSLPPGLVKEGDKSSMAELSTGAEGTAKGYAEFARLERLWLAHMVERTEGVTMSSFILPRHGIESFLSFLRWLVTDGGRARSFHTIFRSVGGVLERLELPNFTTTARVKMLVKELSQAHGFEAEPDTIVTRRILDLMFNGGVIEKQVSAMLRSRTYVVGTIEVMGGARIGEVCGGGDGHGVLANHLSIMHPIGGSFGSSEESVEMWLADSKTSFPRYVNFVGKSHGIGLRGGDYIRSLWGDYGFTLENGMIVESIDDGMVVRRPDYSVLRVSIVDMSTGEVAHLKRAIAKGDGLEIARHASHSMHYLQLRRAAETRSEEYKYINVAGGKADGKRLRVAKAYLESKGLGKFLDVVPGPLIRASRGKAYTHMPLTTDSSYTHYIGAMKAAYKISDALEEHDPELDLEGRKAPKWAHHSSRRKSDKVARETMDDTGATKDDIDDMYGWKQAERAKDMQLHYEGRRLRSRRARISMMV